MIPTDKVEVGFKDIDAAILVGSMPRKEGMERKDLLKANVAIFKTQGAALDKFAKKTVKVTFLLPLQTKSIRSDRIYWAGRQKLTESVDVFCPQTVSLCFLQISNLNLNGRSIKVPLCVLSHLWYKGPSHVNQQEAPNDPASSTRRRRDERVPAEVAASRAEKKTA